MGQDCTILYFGGSLAVAGLLVMALSNHLKNRRVREAMLGHEGMSVPPSIGHLWNEVGLGVILTGAVLFFAWLCFRSDLAPRIAWPVAFGASLLCGSDNPMTAQEIMSVLSLSDPRVVTKLIERERRAGLPICASSNSKRPGYYLADTPGELESYTRSLRRRVKAVSGTLEALEATHDAWTGQTRLDFDDGEADP